MRRAINSARVLVQTAVAYIIAISIVMMVSGALGTMMLFVVGFGGVFYWVQTGETVALAFGAGMILFGILETFRGDESLDVPRSSESAVSDFDRR